MIQQWWLGTCPPVDGPKIRAVSYAWSGGLLTIGNYKPGTFISIAVTHSEDPYIVPGMQMVLEPVDDVNDLKKGDMLARLMSPEECASFLKLTTPVAVYAIHRIDTIGQDAAGWFCIDKPDNFYKAESVKVRKETPKFVLRAIFW